MSQTITELLQWDRDNKRTGYSGEETEIKLVIVRQGEKMDWLL